MANPKKLLKRNEAFNGENGHETGDENGASNNILDSIVKNDEMSNANINLDNNDLTFVPPPLKRTNAQSNLYESIKQSNAGGKKQRKTRKTRKTRKQRRRKSRKN